MLLTEVEENECQSSNPAVSASESCCRTYCALETFGEFQEKRNKRRSRTATFLVNVAT